MCSQKNHDNMLVILLIISTLSDMADYDLFDNEESDDERTTREKKELDAKDRWFGIANSTGIHVYDMIV